MGDLNADRESREVRAFIDKAGLTEPACDKAPFPQLATGTPDRSHPGIGVSRGESDERHRFCTFRPSTDLCRA